MVAMHCVIFAGGKSSRMRSNKALLPFGGYDTLVQYQYVRLKEIFEQVSISTKEPEMIPFVSPVIEDKGSKELFAPTAGFCAMFDSSAQERFFVLSVDAPFVGFAEIQQLVEKDRNEYDATIAKTAGGIHPMCGIYHRSLHVKFQKMAASGRHRLGALLQESHTCFVDFDTEAAFVNMNYRHEYESALLRFKKNVYGGAASDLN